jgi:hypothetical protein
MYVRCLCPCCKIPLLPCDVALHFSHPPASHLPTVPIHQQLCSPVRASSLMRRSAGSSCARNDRCGQWQHALSTGRCTQRPNRLPQHHPTCRAAVPESSSGSAAVSTDAVPPSQEEIFHAAYAKAFTMSQLYVTNRVRLLPWRESTFPSKAACLSY